MLPFPSDAWCRALIAAINSDPETREAGLGWEGDFCGAVLEAPGRARGTDFIFHCRPIDGLVGGFRRLEDLDEVDEIGPSYKAVAPYTAWKAMLEGTLDPFAAILTRQFTFEGDLRPIIERARFREILRRAVASVPTRFASGEEA